MRRLLCVLSCSCAAGCLRGRFQSDRPNHHPPAALHRHRHQRRHRSGSRRRQVRDRELRRVALQLNVEQNKGQLIGTSVGRAPFTFTIGTVGAGGVIPGFDRGVIGMKVGGIRRLIVPPELAYGAAGSREHSAKLESGVRHRAAVRPVGHARVAPTRRVVGRDVVDGGVRRRRQRRRLGRRPRRSQRPGPCRGATSSTPGRAPTSRDGSTTLAAAAGAIRNCRPTPAARKTPPCATARS